MDTFLAETPSQIIVRHVGDGAQPFDPAESLLQPLAAQPVAHLRVRLHGQDLDALRGEFVGEARQHLRGVHVHNRHWEAVVIPVVDYALSLPGVDPERVARLGMSVGGYLAPLAAGCETRLAACVAVDGVHDLLSALRYGISGRVEATDPVPALDKLMSGRRQQPSHLR